MTTKVRLLVDTQVLLWARGAPEKIGAAARSALTDTANEVFVSAVAAWEIVIKHGLGKMHLPNLPSSYVPGRIRELGFDELAFTLEHALAIAGLPPIHSDPFDRAMVAQAQVEGMTMVSADPILLQYPIKVIDARP